MIKIIKKTLILPLLLSTPLISLAAVPSLPGVRPVLQFNCSDMPFGKGYKNAVVKRHNPSEHAGRMTPKLSFYMDRAGDRIYSISYMCLETKGRPDLMGLQGFSITFPLYEGPTHLFCEQLGVKFKIGEQYSTRPTSQNRKAYITCFAPAGVGDSNPRPPETAVKPVTK